MPTLQEPLVAPAFPWSPSGGGPWHSAAGGEQAGTAWVSWEIGLPVHACRKTCWSPSCVRARMWLLSRTPPKSRLLASRAVGQQMPPRQTELLARAGCEGVERAADGPPLPSGLRNTYRDVPAEMKLLLILTGVKSVKQLMGCLHGRNCVEQHRSFHVNTTGWHLCNLPWGRGPNPCLQAPALPLREQSLHISTMPWSSRPLLPRSLLHSSLSKGQLEHGPGPRQQLSCAVGVCVTTRTVISHQLDKGVLMSFPHLCSLLLQQFLMQMRVLGLVKQGKTAGTAQCLPHIISPSKWVGMIYPSLLFAQNTSVMSLNRMTLCCTRYLPLQDQQVFLEQEESPHYLMMPLTQNEGSCCHLKCFLFHQKICLSVLPSSSWGLSIKTDLLAVFSKETRVWSHE